MLTECAVYRRRTTVRSNGTVVGPSIPDMPLLLSALFAEYSYAVPLT